MEGKALGPRVAGQGSSENSEKIPILKILPTFRS